jgi:diguanylate cyclase (GGDEF)-like protein
MTINPTKSSVVPTLEDRPDPRHPRASLERDILLLESGAFHWLQFSPALEELFEAATVAVRVRRFWIEGILCLFIYNSFLISDYLLAPKSFTHFLWVRLGVATPLTIGPILLLRRGVSKKLREAMVVFVCTVFAATILYLYFNLNAVVSSYAVTDLAILILFTNVGIRVRLDYALFAAMICVGLGSVYLQLDRMLTGPEKLESFGILLACTILSLIANYSIERGERLNFLLRLRSDARSGELLVANDHLLQMSNEDRLTQLSNRRHFDEMYKLLWQNGLTENSALSVIMIDIDNFKALNDHYGHLYGDAVISRVAALLKQSLRGQDDFVARYGGEEFVIILPDSSDELVRRVAQRVRSLIEIAGSPAAVPKEAADHGWATVSCGVATTLPHPGVDRSSLIATADKALYRAKAEGRNRVC